MNEDASLRADCGRCVGLCCVALAFDRSALFGEDKPAGHACRHLDPEDRCGIHASRARSGYAGCVAYDCQGAGQLVTAMFGGRSWRDCPDGGKAMFAAFAQARRVQDWRHLLASAAALELTVVLERRRLRLAERLLPRAGWTAVELEQLANGNMRGDMNAFLHDLRSVVARDV